ncbi:putative leader peptide [Streptomyces sp. NPDC046712]
MAAGSLLTARRHLDLGRLASALCPVAVARP